MEQKTYALAKPTHAVSKRNEMTEVTAASKHFLKLALLSPGLTLQNGATKSRAAHFVLGRVFLPRAVIFRAWPKGQSYQLYLRTRQVFYSTIPKIFQEKNRNVCQSQGRFFSHFPRVKNLSLVFIWYINW